MTMNKSVLILVTLLLIVVESARAAPVRCDIRHAARRVSTYVDRLLQHRIEMDIVQIMHRNNPENNPEYMDVNMDVKCFACQESVDLVRILFRRGERTKGIETFITYLCKLLYIETETICRSIIPLFADEILYVLENVVLEPRQICSLLLNNCGTWYNPFQMWNITLPNVPKPEPVKPKLPPEGSSVSRVLHISDIHFDSLYRPGSWVVCNEPLCCRNTSTPKRGQNRTAGLWGDYGTCDIPYWTVENMLNHITQHEEFDYVYWTGDLPPHDVWEQTREGQVQIYKNVTSLFLKYFKDKPIYSALGNHESAPVNSFPPDFVTGNHSTAWLYGELERSWTNWLSNETSSDIKKGAYYTTLIEPGLRLISINSNYCNNLNMWLLLNATDPNRELTWLAETLQQAETDKEKVHIIGHIPPGFPDCLQAWSSNYYRIVNRYENTIAAQFYGHTHNDHFQIFYDTDNDTALRFGSGKHRALGSVFIAPSVTTFLNMNPGYRIYTVDGSRGNSTRMVMDHETYVMNLTEANAGQQPTWRREYTARQAFGLESLFPEDLDGLVSKLENNQTLWERFLEYYYKGRPVACDAACKADMLCSLRSGRSRDKSFC